MLDLSFASYIAYNIAAIEAKTLEDRYIDIEHMFIGLCKMDDMLTVDKGYALGVDEHVWADAADEIAGVVNSYKDIGFDYVWGRRRLRKILSDDITIRGEFSGHRAQRCKDMFSKAENICISEGINSISLKALLEAVIRSDSDKIDQLFEEMSFDRETILDACSNRIKPEEQGENPYQMTNDKKHETDTQDNHNQGALKRTETKTPILDSMGRDITKLANQGKLDPVIGRDDEIRALAQVLIGKRKNNPILVGEAGVGKTCIVEGFAQRAAKDSAHPKIRNFRIVEFNVGSLVAGTKYRGELEERIQNVIKEASSDPNIILFLDEIHMLMGAGSSTEGAQDIANMLKPALSNGEIKCIGATTTSEYRKYIEKDPAFERRFQVVWVNEPTKDETVLILKGLKQRFEEYHNIKIPDSVIVKAVELSIRYIKNYHLPDKAIDIIDRACACKILKTITSSDMVDLNPQPELTIEDVSRIVSEMSRVPVEELTENEQERLLNMEEYIKRRVMGQDKAVHEVTESIRSAAVGLKDIVKPKAVFLFLGATGTGKTELAKSVAEFLFHSEDKLITFDMSEYSEKHSISKLLGSPPGYIGYDQEGQLTCKVRTNPYSVILFDEIEKAHTDIFDIFLQIFDEGRLTDSQGRRVDFSETIIILTSNVGSCISRENMKHTIGFSGQDRDNEDETEDFSQYETQVKNALPSFFKPEIINRIQKIIVFHPLKKETIVQIFEKMLNELNSKLAYKEIKVVLDENVREFIIDNGYSEKYGAREMQRAFDRFVSETISKMILKNEIVRGQTVWLTRDEDGLRFIVI